MILTAFSKYLQLHNEELIHNKTTTTKLLCEWISSVIHKNPSDNVEKIVYKEIMLADISCIYYSPKKTTCQYQKFLNFYFKI